MKNVLPAMGLLILFGCEDMEDGMEDFYEDISAEGQMDTEEEVADKDADGNVKSDSMALTSGFCGDYRYSFYEGRKNGKADGEIHYTDDDDYSIVVCIDPDGDYSEAYYVTLYRRSWWFDENCGTKVFTPPGAGAPVEHTWYNTCIRSDDDYYVVIRQTNPWRWVYGSYGMMSY